MSPSISKKFNFGSLLVFALPTTIMMIVMSLYTIIDGIFVSRFVSTNALSSINIVFPLINVVLGLAIMLAAGSNAIIAKKLGEGDGEGARKTFTAILVLNLLIGIILALVGNLFAVPLARAMGASDLLLTDSVTYLRWQFGFAPAMMLQMLFQTVFVTEGKPGIGLFLTVLAGVLNATLDYILIVPLQMGIAGAAIATVSGYMVPALFGLIYFSTARKTLWLVPFRFSRKEIKESCFNGSSEMVTNISSGVITFLFNLLMMHYVGEDGVAAITIIQYSQFLLNALFMGFSQGVAPIISFNYGSQNRPQLRQVIRCSLISVGVSSLAVFAFSEVAGSYIVEVFARKGTAVYELAVEGFALFAASYLFSGLNIFTSALFTSLSDGRTSAIISFVRTFVLIALCLAVLPMVMGIQGIWLAVPIAELGAVILCIVYLRRFFRKYALA